MSPCLPLFLRLQVQRDDAKNSEANSPERRGGELSARSDVLYLLSFSLGQVIKGNVNGKRGGKGLCSRIFTFFQNNN